MSEAAVVRSVDWKSVFPGPALLVRAAGKSFHPLLVLVGAAGVLLVGLGWGAASWMFLDVENPAPPGPEDAALMAAVRGDGILAKATALEWTGPLNGWIGLGPVEMNLYRFWAPGRELLSPVRPLRHIAFLVFGSLVQLAVWALFGGLIVRKTIVELATDEPHGVIESGEFAARRFGFFFTAPLFPAFGVILLGLPFVLLGFLMRFDPGVFLAGLLWIFVALAGLAAAWLLVALMFAFPLLWGAVATESDGDHFGAVSRMFAYLYQRPLHYLGYVLIIAILGGLGTILVNAAVQTAERFGPWSVSWGLNDIERGELIESEVRKPDPTLRARYTGTRLIRFVRGGLKTLGQGWGAVFFWCGFAGVYLAMRKAVDDREIDEVMLDDDVAPTPATVPPAARPAAAAPTATVLPTEAPPPVAEASTAVESPPPVSDAPPALPPQEPT